MENYTQIKVLGKGSFGAAWLVQRKRDNAQFVAKEVKLSGLKPAEKQEALHEIDMLKVLNHTNITRYIENFEHKGSLYIVMELADGGDLYTKIQGRKNVRFTEKEVLRLFAQLCLALVHMHDKHILHRDLKTQNVFLTKDGTIKLGDFGISTVLRNTYELKRTVCGTPYYFSPELCMNKPYNSKSDVWALGCVLYELTTLNHAFDGTNMKTLLQAILKGVYPPIHTSYSKDLSALISTMLATDPVKRPTVHQILDLPWMKTVMMEFGLIPDTNPTAADRTAALDDVSSSVKSAAELAELRAKDAKEKREREHQQRMDELKKQMDKEMQDQMARIQRMHNYHNDLVGKRKEIEEQHKLPGIRQVGAAHPPTHKAVEDHGGKDGVQLPAVNGALPAIHNKLFQYHQAPAAPAAHPRGPHDITEQAQLYNQARKELVANKARQNHQWW